MKKLILIIIIYFLSFIPVFAKENKLYFTESDDRLYYESKLLDENVFMKHLDMVPGDTFVDELIIENGTNTKYTLYFKVNLREQSSEANELLENIIMKIKLDDEVIYDGIATGNDYKNQGVDLQNAILLGDFSSKRNAKMIVETKLSEDYDNTNFNDLSYIDWSFYGQYDKSEPPTEIIVSPNTMKNAFPFTIIFSIVVVLIGLGIIGSAYKKSI